MDRLNSSDDLVMLRSP